MRGKRKGIKRERRKDSKGKEWKERMEGRKEGRKLKERKGK